MFPNVSDLDKTNLWLSSIMEIEVNRGYNPSGDSSWWHVCVVSSCLPACCNVRYWIAVWSGRNSTRNSQNYKTLRVQLNKIGAFLAETLQKVSDPSKQQTAPRGFWDWSFNWCRCFTPSPGVGYVFRACLKIPIKEPQCTQQSNLSWCCPKGCRAQRSPSRTTLASGQDAKLGSAVTNSWRQASCVGWKALYLPPSVDLFLHHHFPICSKTCDFWSFSYKRQNNKGEVEVDWTDQCH